MYDIEVPFAEASKHYKIESYTSKPENKPYHTGTRYFNGAGIWYFVLDDDLHLWFVDTNISYRLSFNNGRFWISVKTIDEFILIKLTWG
jgi:hypothetical protein